MRSWHSGSTRFTSYLPACKVLVVSGQIVIYATNPVKKYVTSRYNSFTSIPYWVLY
jgi:hypothetical protein